MASRLWRNGKPLTSDDARDLAFAGFAHFTAMQVRDGAVRGLDLHLTRLQSASRDLFGREVDNRLLRDRMRQAAATGPRSLSLVVTIRAAEGEFVPAEVGRPLDVTVQTGAPSDGPSGPLRLDVVEHERFLPHVKHVGEGAKTYYLRRARHHGFDDAVFLDRTGRISEGTIWNLAFSDGDTVIWPRADLLTGTTMQVVRRQLHRAGVPQDEREVRPADLGGLSAVLMNSWTPAVPVTSIGDRTLTPDPEFERRLRNAFDVEAPEQL
ncbi:aminotransferase class IV family protein [Pseudonocardia sp. C8]|uniref:aminotransferase class IV family protein n=1 Tax=Pseudonocardia sp. C8 TaxID=2762759 RepID=UPI001642AF9E|nr:aminotransferase class IV family protein [Pseudonocardia sp. C8]MBC3189964.1 aminotransferase class IV family protein [Pseudonocardia sp. C8]